jgi:hypothetical protein
MGVAEPVFEQLIGCNVQLLQVHVEEKNCPLLHLFWGHSTQAEMSLSVWPVHTILLRLLGQVVILQTF